MFKHKPSFLKYNRPAKTAIFQDYESQENTVVSIHNYMDATPPNLLIAIVISIDLIIMTMAFKDRLELPSTKSDNLFKGSR